MNSYSSARHFISNIIITISDIIVFVTVPLGEGILFNGYRNPFPKVTTKTSATKKLNPSLSKYETSVLNKCYYSEVPIVSYRPIEVRILYRTRMRCPLINHSTLRHQSTCATPLQSHEDKTTEGASPLLSNSTGQVHANMSDDEGQCFRNTTCLSEPMRRNSQ
jgi:hypothetical protein